LAVRQPIKNPFLQNTSPPSRDIPYPIQKPNYKALHTVNRVLYLFMYFDAARPRPASYEKSIFDFHFRFIYL